MANFVNCTIFAKLYSPIAIISLTSIHAHNFVPPNCFLADLTNFSPANFLSFTVTNFTVIEFLMLATIS